MCVNARYAPRYKFYRNFNSIDRTITSAIRSYPHFPYPRTLYHTLPVYKVYFDQYNENLSQSFKNTPRQIIYKKKKKSINL